MGFMTGEQFKDYVVEEFERDDKDTQIYTALSDSINHIRKLFAFNDFKVEAWSGAITTLGDYKIDLPTDLGLIVGKLRLLDGDDGYTLGKRDKEQFDELYPHPNATNVDRGFPKHWCIFDNSLLIGPVPDKTTYLFEFSYSEDSNTIYTSASVNVPFTDKYREGLRLEVIARVLAGMDEERLAAAKAGRAASFWKSYMGREMKNNYAQKNQRYEDF